MLLLTAEIHLIFIMLFFTTDHPTTPHCFAQKHIHPCCRIFSAFCTINRQRDMTDTWGIADLDFVKRHHQVVIGVTITSPGDKHEAFSLSKVVDQAARQEIE